MAGQENLSIVLPITLLAPLIGFPFNSYHA